MAAFKNKDNGTWYVQFRYKMCIRDRFQLLEKQGIQTHYVEELNDRDTVVKKVTIVPLEVIVRNKAAGSLSKRLGLEEGTPMGIPVLEFSYKDDDLGDPMVNEYHILAAGFATKEEVDTISEMALKVNEILCDFFKSVNIELIDFKLEFGKLPNGEITVSYTHLDVYKRQLKIPTDINYWIDQLKFAVNQIPYV